MYVVPVISQQNGMALYYYCLHVITRLPASSFGDHRACISTRMTQRGRLCICVLFTLMFFLPVDIQHTQCPCRVFLLEKYFVQALWSQKHDRYI